METIEIRQNKKLILPIIAIIILTVFTTACYIVFSSKFTDRIYFKAFYILICVLTSVGLYYPFKRAIKNEPILIIDKTGIKINDKIQPSYFSWTEIFHWSIDKDNESPTFYLTIKSYEKLKRVNISWLDKRPNDIQEILRKYI